MVAEIIIENGFLFYDPTKIETREGIARLILQPANSTKRKIEMRKIEVIW